MKNAEVVGRAEVLALLDIAGLSGVRLSYAITHNAKVLAEEAKKIKDALKYPEDFLKMREEYTEIFKEHAKKNSKGELIVEDNKWILDPEKAEKYNEIVKTKLVENKEIVDKAKLVEEEYEMFLNQEAVLPTNLVTLKLEALPETITPAQMSALSFMVEELSV
jgi:hypothetical protein